MKENAESGTSIKAYAVWDRTTRLFHWINVVCVLTLTILGLAILNAKAFGVSSDGKILLKTLHAYVGYGFAINLVWRFVWAFIGSPSARWQAISPAVRGFPSAVRTYVQGFFNKEPPIYLGHNPLGRLMVSVLLFLLLTQASTGLVLAGTDLYKPPFGSAIAEWVTGGDPEKLANLEPGSKDFVDPVAYQSMRNFRSPIITTHLYVFYLLMFLIFLHITGVVITEVRERNGIISAMFTGEKILPATPIDMQSAPSGNGRKKQAGESRVIDPSKE